MQGRQALRCAGYGVRVDEALGALDLSFELYLALFKAGGEFQPVEQGGDGVEVLGAVHLGDHDRIQPVAGLFDDLDQVSIEVRRVEGVGAIELSPAPPVELLYGTNDVSSSRRLSVRGDCVFEVEEYRV